MVFPKNNWAPLVTNPPPTLSVTEISISVLECLVLQLETHLVRGGLSTEPFKEANASAWSILTRLDLGRRISISALECLVLQLETHLVRGGLSGEP